MLFNKKHHYYLRYVWPVLIQIKASHVSFLASRLFTIEANSKLRLYSRPQLSHVRKFGSRDVKAWISQVKTMRTTITSSRSRLQHFWLQQENKASAAIFWGRFFEEHQAAKWCSYCSKVTGGPFEIWNANPKHALP